MSHRINRRKLLQGTLAAGTLTVLPAGLARGYAANETVNLGIIGVGGMGAGNRAWFKRIGGNNIVALCDADARRVEDSLKDHPGAKTYVDYRQMFDQHKNIDAVMVSTPDHHHYPASMLAIKLGKGVCTEKPLTHSVWEARQLAKAAAEHKVATQMDNEGHAGEGLRRCVELVQSGAIGPIREVHIWTDRPIWPQGIAQRPAAKPVPAGVNWDLWIGPAPYRDYHDHLHPFAWRGWWDFGTGALGDMGCHFWDSAVWGLKLGHPTTVEAVQEGNSAETGPHWSVVAYEFPAREGLPPVTVKWWDGRKPSQTDGQVRFNVPNLPPPPPGLEPSRKLPGNGSMFIGQKATILVHDTGGWSIVPESQRAEIQEPARFLPRVSDHKVEWLEAVKGGKPASSNFPDYSSHLAEVVLLGNVAIRTGTKLQWDGVNLKATNCPNADQYIRREYRKGWDI
jgi:predicted dehydrogenase